MKRIFKQVLKIISQLILTVLAILLNTFIIGTVIDNLTLIDKPDSVKIIAVTAISFVNVFFISLVWEDINKSSSRTRRKKRIRKNTQ